MIKKIILSITLLFSFFLISCNQTDNFDPKVLDNYIIEKGEEKNGVKITKLSECINPNVISEVTIELDWVFDKSTLFFMDDCQMTRNELGALVQFVENNECKFEKQKHKMSDTPFYSYNMKQNNSKVKYSFKTASLDKNKLYAIYYICDLQEYKITSKETNQTFNVYFSSSNFFVSLENIN